MTDELYKEFIIDHYQNPRNFGKMEDADYSFRNYNSLCGDLVQMQIKTRVENGEERIERVKFLGSGCAISIASASLLTDYVKGKPVEEAGKLEKDEVLGLLKIELSPTRLKCALLPLEALQRALKEGRIKN